MALLEDFAIRIRTGDRAAEEEFVRAFEPRVRALARFRMRDSESARDVTQEVLMAALQAMRNGAVHEPERLAAFVHGIARNLINHYFRSRDPLPAREPLESDLVWRPEDRDRRDLVAREIEALDALDRRILLMTLVDGSKPGEIAAQLGLSGDVVRQRKVRATRRIAARLSQMGAGKPQATGDGYS
ncbi:MAG: sigma-70 family RNA polymerase sigma factor [Acidobacteria bacterium]|nr:sigma-70 family RNA polymerase sigma factor [Acidobacteriota bacterium]